SVHGVQVSGGVNIARDGVRGVQVAPLANIAGSGRGGQVGYINVTPNWRGVQVGAVNLAREVTGVQVGILNINRTSGASVGLLNIHYAEPAYVQTWYTTNGMLMYGVRHGGRYLHYTYAMGNSMTGFGDFVIAMGGGIGTRIPFEQLYIDIDLLGFEIIPIGSHHSWPGSGILNQLRVTLGWKLFRRLAFFGSGALSFLGPRHESINAIIPSWAFQIVGGEGMPDIWVWPELQLGVRF
ncbi:MAG: LA_2272 family surface repeat-containing protein, partial [Bradymonadaceae bacterium]